MATTTRGQASGQSAAARAAAAATNAAKATASVNLQRIVKTVDPLSEAGATLGATLTPFRTAAVSRIFTGIELVSANLTNILAVLTQPVIPSPLIGVLQQPDGTKASGLQIQFDPRSVGGSGDPVTVLTDDAHGGFSLPVPSGLSLPANGISFLVHGVDGNAQVTVLTSRIASNGLIGAVKLPVRLAPLPVSILQALGNITSGWTSPTGTPAPAPPQLPSIKLGESGPCQLAFNGNHAIDAFPFGVFFRLVAPQLSIVQQVTQWKPPNSDFFLTFPIYATGKVAAGTTPSYADRVPVEQPISVDGFRDQIMGLTINGTFTADETVPMAATLGLGYVLWMSQQWTYQGLALGNLVYSLPLSPGEQQQVAVFERVDTARVFESEALTEEQQQQQAAVADTSTNATFNSAFHEAASGGSSFQTHSDTSSWGASIILVSGGGGSSDSSGTSSSWLQGQRDTAQQAAQTTHSAAENQASARRSASRTGMRLATSSEQEAVTTKTITNHNHAHALTMQYWEVERLYDVTTAVDGLILTCLVPLQIVRFMPPGQPLTISDNSLSSRAAVLARYSAIIKHMDVLQTALPRAFQSGLMLLRQFVSDPSAEVEPFGGVAEDVIKFSLTGNFVPCEDISVSAVTDRNTRIGPVRLAPPSGFVIQQDKYTSRDDLLAALGWQRQLVPTTFTGALALPPSLNRTNVVGFEISRNYRQLNYTLWSAELASLEELQTLFGSSGTAWIEQAIQSQLATASSTRTTVHVAPSELETALGGPMLFNFSAQIEEFDAQGQPQPATKGETYANDSLNGIVLPQQPYPVPALQVAPVLRYNELLTIEAMVQHVLRNTTRYSKAVWSSLTAEERAILLDQYTIGVPPNGLSDPSQMVPLLNCVENRLLGFFGNSMILPFKIPQAVAEQMNIDPVKVQQSLLAYQQSSFIPPHSTIALPTRGVLGEAVLGHCPSAEKIDLTRFWNWQDSPSDTAPTVSPVTLPTTTPSTAAGLTAPNTLGQLPSLINNVLTAPAPSTSLLQAMGQAAASQQDFSTSLTGQAQLASLITNAQNVSNAARADALKTTKDLTSQAMATVGNIVGAKSGNPNAGSSAAAAVNGTSGGGSAAAPATPAKPAATGTPGTKPSTTSPPASGGAGSGATGTGSTGDGSTH